jgi:F-type H+-transporting ATPase subunit a
MAAALLVLGAGTAWADEGTGSHGGAPAAAAAQEGAGHGAAQGAGHGAAEGAGHGGHEEEALSWFTLLLDEHAHEHLRATVAAQSSDTLLPGPGSFTQGGSFTHVFFAAVAALLLILGAVVVRGRLARDPAAGVLPEKTFGVFLFFELVSGAVWDLMKGMMGAEEARRHFPLVCTLAFYIFTMNALALLPLGAPATANLNTNVVMGLAVFLVTHISGIRAQGLVGYLKHFCGPLLALAPLMFIIEIISHCVRPVSLSLRLMGNMTGDHKVLDIFLGFQVPLVPLPVMILGLMVVVVQTLVFVLLSTVYLAMAVAHHDHGDEHAHDHH